MKQIQHGQVTRVADQFEAVDLRAPFKVFLNRSVKVTIDKTTGKQLSYQIPDVDGLVQAIVISRVLHPRRLNGGELKFLRKAVEMQQKELAENMELSVEYLSRCENNMHVMSPQTEKLMRVYFLKTAVKLHKMNSCEAKTRLDEWLDKLFDDHKPISVFDPDDALEFHFYHGKKASKNKGPAAKADDPGQWDEAA